MSNSEHLIENALASIERKEPEECFFKAKHNVEMARALGISLDTVYSMAVYVYYTYVPCIHYDIENKLREEYGY